ncbi:MAG: hypothetical protein AB7I41_15275 [Candidatus Sericytochromatia bacterium]
MSAAMPFDDLSAYLDQELTDIHAIHVQQGLGESLPALVEVRNMESLTRACQNLSQTPSPSRFEDSLFARLDALGWEQEDPADDFENLSAYSDGEDIPEEAPSSETAQTHLHNLKVLAQAIQTLPTPEINSTDFAERLMAFLPEPIELTLSDLSAVYDQQELEPDVLSEVACATLKNFSVLTRSLQALPVPAASAEFYTQLESLLDTCDELSFETLSAGFDEHEVLSVEMARHPLARQHSHNFSVLSQALQALPTPDASESFAQGLLARLDSIEIAPEFELVSACFDQDLELSAQQLGDAQVQTELQNIQALSQALKALPLTEASPAFLQRLSAQLDAVDSQQKKQIFALPRLLQGRYARMVAGIAFFGLLVSFSQQMLDNQMAPSQEAGTTADVVPTDHVIDLENQAENDLFVDLQDSFDNTTDEDYNNLIEG